MTMRGLVTTGLVLGGLAVVGETGRAQSPAPVAPAPADASTENAALAAVRAAVENYVAAFNAADAAGIAACWASDGVYVAPDGSRVQGALAILEYFQDYFAENPGLNLVVQLESLRLVGDDVAIEEGQAFVEREGEKNDETTYLALHRRTEQGWKLETIRETVLPEASQPVSPLADLAWLVGQWQDASEPGVEVQSVYHWAQGGQFLVNNFNVVIENQVDLQGTQIIGWDPAAKLIRSWMFDSDGGFGQGQWIRGENDGQWHVKMHSTLPDGQTASALNHYSRADDDLLMWSSTQRRVGDATLPDVAPIAVRREAATP